MKPEEKEKYLTILAMFTSHDEENVGSQKGFMLNPFTIDDKVFATDGIIMVMFDKRLTFDIDGLRRMKPESVLQAIPSERNNNFSIKTAVLQEAINKSPIEDDTSFVNIKTRCHTCQGADKKCEDCEGTGTLIDEVEILNGNKRFSLGYHVIIKSSSFSVMIFNKVMQVAKILNAEEIVLTHQTENNRASIFKIGEVELMVMPTMYCDDNSILNLQ